MDQAHPWPSGAVTDQDKSLGLTDQRHSDMLKAWCYKGLHTGSSRPIGGQSTSYHHIW